MKKILTILLIVALATACGSRVAKGTESAANQVVEPIYYGYRVKASYPHSRDHYTQGFQYAEGLIWEGTGQHGASRLLSYELGSTSSRLIAQLPRREFGEGITLHGGEIFQLTWTNNTAHVYDRQSGKERRTLRYTGEGWGLTSDGERLYLSDGTANLYQIDPQTFRRERTIPVSCNGEPLEFLNELEWIDGKIWANVYTTDWIAIINPTTGQVEGLVDCRGLLPEEERTPTTDVLNGIAHDPATGRIFLTGKNWSRIFEVEIFKQ
ncbi:MAG: glutaminyl-peptide cyclotransferase [Alistipes sp.]|nr:glutaminyl-peptide cyclotransferase [Alistipes sp.]